MYELLGQIYKEILEIFDTDVVHMGGDEVRDSLSLGYLRNVRVIWLHPNCIQKLFISIYCLGQFQLLEQDKRVYRLHENK